MQYTEVEPQAEKIRNWDAWSKWVLFLLLGYSLTGRSFAYLGIPPAKLFIGDLTLAAFIFLRPRRLFDPWIKALTRTSPLSPFAWFLLASISYGIFEVIRGILAGFSPVIALENLVFNIYPIFMFLGIWVGARRPELLLKYIQIYAVLFCIYAPAYLLFLNKIVLTMPGSDGVTVFGQAGGGGFIILALLCLDPKPSRFWLPMTVGAIQFLAGQVRAEWVGMGMALLIWGVLSKKMSKVAAFGAAIVLLLAVGFLLDVNIPSPQERGGNISSQEIVARGLAAVSPALAQDVTGSANVGFYNGTITWRETWWRAIWANSQENYTNLLIGPGYGFLLKNLVNYLKTFGDIRTPHNIFYYALGYSGWIGVIIFFSLQGACGVLVWRAYKLTGQSFGVAIWASSLFTAFFGNAFETPSGAIPSYLTLGLIIGPTLAAASYPLRQTLFHSEPYPAAYPPQSAYAPDGAYTSEAI
jgi:O-Antigen ligase